MKNPWTKLPLKKPFVLLEDRIAIDRYNSFQKERKIYLDLPPDPFIGDINSGVILLNANPGYNKEEVNYSQNNREFIRINRRNMLHQGLEYPFYAINPKFKGWKGYKWWVKKLNPLIKSVNNAKLLSRNICCLELIGYHSKKIPYNLHLYSQKYTKYLVEEAIRRRAVIVIMRAKEEWYKLVPNLKKYQFHCILNSPQNVIISPGNLPKGWFDKILSKF